MTVTIYLLGIRASIALILDDSISRDTAIERLRSLGLAGRASGNTIAIVVGDQPQLIECADVAQGVVTDGGRIRSRRKR